MSFNGIEKYKSICKMLDRFSGVAVAFSGGVDSALLAYVTHDILNDNMLALIADIPTMARRELHQAISFCEKNEIPYEVVPVNTLECKEVQVNGPQRCYECKYAMMFALKAYAAKRGIEALVDGTNADDDASRPGMKALFELNVKSPLRDLGITKKDVRSLAKELELDVWDKPSHPCLATYLPDNCAVTLEKLKQVEEDVFSSHLPEEKTFSDIGYARVDLDRNRRCGFSEVIYGEGKTVEQIAGILEVMQNDGQESVLITRLDRDAASLLQETFKLDYDETSKTAILGEIPKPDGIGVVVVACAGTSDVSVAEEAVRTLEILGNDVVRLYDVGVAGVHRLLANEEDLAHASAIVVVAGMDGALASVVGGLVSCPVIAVPTSVGYGASFGGLSALLAMLNSCSSGVSVVNIDNGFGAAVVASRVNHPHITE